MNGFEFVSTENRTEELPLAGRPIGYFRDAWSRFRKNRASIAAGCIILLIVLYALLTPLLITRYDSSFMDVFYAKKPPRLSFFRRLDLGSSRNLSEKGLIRAAAIGIGAEDRNGSGTVSLEKGLASLFQPILKIGTGTELSEIRGTKPKIIYPCRIDPYLEVGFLYRSMEQNEYRRILAWQEETGRQVFYPLIETNEYNADPTDANNWYKTRKGVPVTTKNGSAEEIPFGDGMVLEDNYRRDSSGNPIYYEFSGGGTAETAQYRVRVLYFNYYVYRNGFEPEYPLGTDSQGYDMALRLAGGIRLSLLVALFVSAVNLTIGAVYGAVEGYYGGTADLILERIADILSGIPFVVAATLFQIHLSDRAGAVPSLLFAFVLTGWISTANRVRTQFYRFREQEYVLAARTLGAGDGRIILKHIFPNAIGTVITSSVMVIPGVINSESMLSYLGIVKLGGAAGTSLGTLMADASGIWTGYPHLMLFPAAVLSLLMISFNLFGNGLRDAFNPSLRGTDHS